MHVLVLSFQDKTMDCSAIEMEPFYYPMYNAWELSFEIGEAEGFFLNKNVLQSAWKINDSPYMTNILTVPFK